MRTFRSDNNAGLCSEAIDALIQANDDAHHIGYGDDPYTARAIEAFRSIFGERISVWFVATGTAANTLAIASLTRPWQQVLCHAHSHYNDDESTAPERLTQCRTVQLHTQSSKLTPHDIANAAGSRGDVHQAQPGVLTLSNPTEFGTLYTPAEMRALCEVAHDNGYRVHVDGARFANAVAALQCDPRDLTSRAGVDALSFGGTKNGLAYGEAVVFFPQGDGGAYERAAAEFAFHRKSTGHLLSKHRFVSAPFAAVLENDIWLRHAGHANAMAQQLAAGLSAMEIVPAYPVEANGVFVQLPRDVDAAWQTAGYGYYPFGDAADNLSRLMCSFNTRSEDIEQMLADAKR